jgi:hypothetical protein
MTKFWELMKGLWRFSARVFIFGLACSLVLAAVGAGYWYYQNRTVPAKTWKPDEEEKDYGVRFFVKTEWVDGNTKYELKILPFEKDAFLPLDSWSAWENENRKIFFVVHLMDAGNFAVENCSTEHLLATSEAASVTGTPGKITSVQFEGTLPFCSRHQYLSAVSSRVTWSLPVQTTDPYAALAHDATSAPVVIKVDPPKSHSTVHHVRATWATDINTREYGTLACGHVEKGETVILLQEDSAFVKIKTNSGKIGWAGSAGFEVVD